MKHIFPWFLNSCVFQGGKKFHLFLIHLCLTHQDIIGEEVVGVYITLPPP